jgi:succinoglycan biosynthesis protein ExoV
MKLYYYRHKRGRLNLGDDLNPWLWDRLLPGVFDDDPDSQFVGIGTLLNDRLPPARRTVVFSSGVGYGGQTPRPTENWTIYCLRGPISASLLGVDPALAITDGAMLVARMDPPPATGGRGDAIGYMPHVYQIIDNGPAYRSIAEDQGMRFIDPSDEVPKVLEQIASCRLLITEALHGAIIADALRVPWIPVASHHLVYPQKWHDWCQSMNLTYQPHRLPAVWTPRPDAGALVRLRFAVKRRLLAMRLKSVLARGRPVLSNQAHLESVLDRLQERLLAFKTDHAAGRFR